MLEPFDPTDSKENQFFDVTFFNSDTFDTEPVNVPGATKAQLTGDIAEIYFRIDVDDVVHSRQVY